ncbi:hypothetical protein HNR11_002697 [Nesterenkonia sandarakina]|uniref:Uncharacterized protein n=1 Tax=Nesterenkonia sandarakina TaxID=272918 RepID=A0A7Z0EBZ4_9MICC|nr:hypothetical protein [Nesterenkonia sandarakina]
MTSSGCDSVALIIITITFVTAGLAAVVAVVPVGAVP